MSIKYIKADLFEYIENKSDFVICHIVNNVGKFGAGFTKPLSLHYPKVKDIYLSKGA